ncbi:hypothetical protein MRB53_041964 [Persea americana]|nr:hypothetical protein MRB53_041964 [Persea americana]
MRRVILCYRKLIDAQAARPWDQLVFADSYRELRLQAQYFNPQGQHRTFGELLHHVPAAERLHGLVRALPLRAGQLRLPRPKPAPGSYQFLHRSAHLARVGRALSAAEHRPARGRYRRAAYAPAAAAALFGYSRAGTRRPARRRMTTLPQTSARIYLADQRGLCTTPQQQRFSTFNFGTYRAEGRAPFGQLLAFNEESLAPGQAVTFAVAQAVQLLLLPIVGAVTYLGPAGLLGTTDVEQAQLLALPAGTTMQLRNPYEGEVVTFLHIWLAGRVSTARGAPVFRAAPGLLRGPARGNAPR